MKACVPSVVAALLILSAVACKQQPAKTGMSEAAEAAAAASLESINGTWRVDLASLKFEGRPDEYLLQDGYYSCATCIPPLKVSADGAVHRVADRPYYDAMSVKIVDDDTVELRRQKGGKNVSVETQSVSEDGNTMTTRFKDMTTPGQTIEGTSSSKRAWPAPAGAHAISGQWRPDKISDYTEEAQSLTFNVSGNTVTSSGQGQDYTAKLGGAAVAVKGDTGGTMIKVAREGVSALRETIIRNGKEVGYSIITPDAAGKTINYVYTDSRDGSTISWTGKKEN